MSSDYSAIRELNQKRYGTDIGRIGKMLLANQYDDRTHFIYELLQNAEDAMARRGSWTGSRSISFALARRQLRVTHFGQPFDADDVRAICGIAESHKRMTDIGRFGIGFKSVYAYTARPEIHSGDEDFAIEDFVLPVETNSLQRSVDETLILIPLESEDTSDFEEIAEALSRLESTHLLFLREIESIEWDVIGGGSGRYWRRVIEVDNGVRMVTTGGTTVAEPRERSWMVFSRLVSDAQSIHRGYAEIAYQFDRSESEELGQIGRVTQSPLVVCFPTAVETHLGFLAQGPFRTTPSRDNVPKSDEWNSKLVNEIASLLSETLLWLRDQNLMAVPALECLPMDSSKFDENSRFSPLFTATRETLLTEPLIPTADGGHVSATRARLARAEDLRNLLSSSQLTALIGSTEHLAWVTGDITQDRTPQLHGYFTKELAIEEVDPETIMRQMSQDFLEAQSDGWIERLYQYLVARPRLARRLQDLPLVRLEDGSHVVARKNGHPQAFLPGPNPSGFPIVRRSVLSSGEARQFLEFLDLTEPNPADEVIRNILPFFEGEEVAHDEDQYRQYLQLIASALTTDSQADRARLVAALRETPFVRAIDATLALSRMMAPRSVYLPTASLLELFEGVAGVFFVDRAPAYLREPWALDVFAACGASSHLRVTPDPGPSKSDLGQLRQDAGHAQTSGQNDHVVDRSLAGLAELLNSLCGFPPPVRAAKSAALWGQLLLLYEARGKSVFEAEYRWTHYGNYRTVFDASFIRCLNSTPWVSDADGNLRLPESVDFAELGWEADPVLLSVIRFRPSAIDTLAQEAGIEPGVLDLLKEHGVISVRQLSDLLGVSDKNTQVSALSAAEPASTSSDEGILSASSSRERPDQQQPRQTAVDSGVADTVGDGFERSEFSSTGSRAGSEGEISDLQNGEPGRSTETQRANHSGRSAGLERKFISYVAVQPGPEPQNTDDVVQERLLEIESRAIELILSRESGLRRARESTEGFDLYETEGDGRPVRWIEVKAMTGDLKERPVGLSRAQFRFAQAKGGAFWLYVVEHATGEEPRILRIQDPAGKAMTFTFDYGWAAVADLKLPVESP